MEKTIKELFLDIGIETKRSAGQDKVLCPKCSSDRKNKKDPCLSIDLGTGEYNCHNQCGFKGGVIKNRDSFVPKPKEYIKPVFNNRTQLCNGMIKYFEGRCIYQQSLLDFKITESVRYMPKLEKEVNTINFNYFREGELVNIKFRPAKKAFVMVKDAELIFYNLDAIKDSEWCVITEGEIDCISFHQSGIKEVVSVPNGASKGANLEYLDNCIDYFSNKTKIIIATDNDEAGASLRDELARRLGYDICFKVDFGDCKDANEFLQAHGPEKLSKLISKDALVEFPMAGIITADMVWEDVEWLLEHGLKRGDITGVLDDFDKLVSFVPGQLMALTGIPNHGKSPFALLIMASLSLNAKWKWGIYSPEHKPLAIFLVKICELLLGKRARSGFGFAKSEKDLAKDFISEHFIFIEPEDDNYSLDSILDKAKRLVTRKGIRGLLIDPWNKLEHNMGKGDNETMYISKELDKVIKFNQRNSVFSIIIAHPTKIRKNLKSTLFEVPNLYDIAGSANWFNKVDIGVCFYRNFQTGMSEIYVQKIKYEHLGMQGMCEVKYNVNNSRFVNLNGGWDNSNWLLPKNAQVNIALFDQAPSKIEILDNGPEYRDAQF
jgi:twinkle protein